ncbi:MAG: hypothetical protein JNL11_00350 [Bdellovibrionaceae bacterium]|nr:hypothetical protein [Pseudobdellovibrionaceae bacterium]
MKVCTGIDPAYRFSVQSTSIKYWEISPQYLELIKRINMRLIFSFTISILLVFSSAVFAQTELTPAQAEANVKLRKLKEGIDLVASLQGKIDLAKKEQSIKRGQEDIYKFVISSAEVAGMSSLFSIIGTGFYAVSIYGAKSGIYWDFVISTPQQLAWHMKILKRWFFGSVAVVAISAGGSKLASFQINANAEQIADLEAKIANLNASLQQAIAVNSMIATAP